MKNYTLTAVIAGRAAMSWTFNRHACVEWNWTDNGFTPHTALHAVAVLTLTNRAFYFLSFRILCAINFTAATWKL